MRANDINFSAFNYSKSTFDAFCSLCSPLTELNISGFAYLRLFNNGRYLYFCNDLNWLEFSLKNNGHFNQGILLERELVQARDKSHFHCSLWPTEKTDNLMSALHAFNIWNGLSVFKSREDSIEIWAFAADRKNNLASYTHSLNQRYDSNPVDIEAFIKATDINKIPIITDSGEIYLSKKEVICLNHLAVGKSAKEIGLDLGISQRTIEKQIENIRYKFDPALTSRTFH